MKNSNIQWIGDIPDNWEVSKFKYESKVQYGYPFDSDKFSNENGFPLIRIRDITSGKIETYYDGKYPQEYIVTKGDILIGMDGDFNIRVWDNDNALLNQRCCRIIDTNNPQLSIKYLYYFLILQLKITNDLTWSTTVKHLLADTIENISVCVPPLPTQTAIANFLDAKCGEIDALLSDINKQIDTLNELKKATITEQFKSDKYLKLKHIGDFQNGVNFNANKKDKMIKFLGVGDFKDKIILNAITDFSETLEDRTFGGNELLKSGDIVFVRSNGSKDLVGRSIMVDNIDFPLTYSGFCIRYRVNKEGVNRKYLLYYFRTNAFKETIWNGNMGTAINNLSQGVLGNIPVPVPPLSEQQSIADYLDAKCAEFDATINEKRQQISALENYKKSLIYEYVTGKKEV